MDCYLLLTPSMLGKKNYQMTLEIAGLGGSVGCAFNLPRWLSWMRIRLASVAQLDAHPTGDQEVAGSTCAKSATFFG